ncbi:MAG: hypothetical protein ACREP7_17255 [Lysobacter sp.]
MLELFFVDRAATAPPETPDGLQHAGSLGYDDHRALSLIWSECEQAGLRLSYFEDSLLSVGQIERMLAIFDARIGQPGSDHPAFAQVRALLTRAVDSGCGLVTYCD